MKNVSLDLGPHLHKPTLSNSTFGKLTFWWRKFILPRLWIWCK